MTALTGVSLGRCAQRPAAGRCHGFPDFNVTTYCGMLAPRSTPASIVAQLSKTMQETARLPEVLRTLQRQGAQAFASSPDGTPPGSSRPRSRSGASCKSSPRFSERAAPPWHTFASRSWAEARQRFFVALIVDLVDQYVLGPAELARRADAELARQGVLAALKDHQVLGPADLCNQWLHSLVIPVQQIKLAHIQKMSRRENPAMPGNSACKSFARCSASAVPWAASSCRFTSIRLATSTGPEYHRCAPLLVDDGCVTQIYPTTPP